VTNVRAAALVLLLFLAGCRAHNPLALSDSTNLQSDFARASSQTRILLLISPT